MVSRFCLIVIIWLFSPAVAAQAPVCSTFSYGTLAQARSIEEVLQSGSVSQSVAAIRAAQASRGTELGCADVAYSLNRGDATAPTLAQIREAWRQQTLVATQSLEIYDQCPAIGRGAGAYALGGWMARAGSLEFAEAPLNVLAENFVATQYGIDKTPGEQQSWAGMFSYAERTGDPQDTCYIPGVVGEGATLACGLAPSLCVSYRSGRFANQRFVVGDYHAASGIRDGGAGFDQGWAGLMMIEAALGTSERPAAARYRQAALAAADWAVSEPAVRNHNYTAKLIWLLAAAYDWTGEAGYRTALVDKLERSLLPGILMDQNADGQVDGVPGVRFSELKAPAARTPGRMWDAHNALPWYQAMNAIALIEATAAFKARGDLELLQRVQPFALAVLDNLAAELQAGTSSVGGTNVAYAFASGLWKLSDPQGLRKPEWERVLWRIWNAGLGASPGDSKTATAAIIAVRAEGRAWRPYRSRGARSSVTPPLDARISGLWYDPATPGEGLNLTLVAADRLVLTWHTYRADGSGEPLWIIADGAFDGRHFSGAAVTVRGTNFGAGFNAANVQQSSWGEIVLEFTRCDAATLTWRSDQPAFGRGTRNLIKLSGIVDSGC